jgi:ribA/ribD-fused uncharacterized protein
MNVIAFTKVSLPYGWLGNMAPYPIEYEGKRYRTSEALFQCLRFNGHLDVQETIRAQKSPMAAKMMARKHRHLFDRPEWDEAEDDIPRMRRCLELKLAQHPSLVTQLLDTGDALLVEDCTARPRGSARFWAAVREHDAWSGRNVLGTLWMDLRAEVRAQSA